jgi:hypothetical protein
MAELKDNPPSQSREEVAFKLLYLVAWGENIDLEAWGKADRDWILGTYAECLRTVENPNARPLSSKPSAAAHNEKKG